MSYEDVLKIELIHLRETHRDLDHAIEALYSRVSNDSLSLKRLKRNKLALKDKIARLEDKLTQILLPKPIFPGYTNIFCNI